MTFVEEEVQVLRPHPPLRVSKNAGIGLMEAAVLSVKLTGVNVGEIIVAEHVVGNALILK